MNPKRPSLSFRCALALYLQDLTGLLLLFVGTLLLVNGPVSGTADSLRFDGATFILLLQDGLSRPLFLLLTGVLLLIALLRPFLLAGVFDALAHGRSSWGHMAAAGIRHGLRFLLLILLALIPATLLLLLTGRVLSLLTEVSPDTRWSLFVDLSRPLLLWFFLLPLSYVLNLSRSATVKSGRLRLVWRGSWKGLLSFVRWRTLSLMLLMALPVLAYLNLNMLLGPGTSLLLAQPFLLLGIWAMIRSWRDLQPLPHSTSGPQEMLVAPV